MAEISRDRAKTALDSLSASDVTAAISHGVGSEIAPDVPIRSSDIKLIHSWSIFAPTLYTVVWHGTRVYP